MNNYVELLRVSRAFRVLAFVLAAVVVGAIVLRIVAWHYGDGNSQIATLTSSPTAHVARSVLPDGTKKIVIDDPAKHLHAQVLDRGYEGKQITITNRGRSQHASKDHMSFGGFDVNQTQNGDTEHVSIYTNSPNGIRYFAMAALPLILLFATLLGGPFAKENDGHLEVAWTKPVSRIRYGLSAIALDTGAVVVALIVTMVVFMLCVAIFERPHLSFGGSNVPDSIEMLLTAIALYALLTAASAWIRRGPGPAIGLVWACILFLPALAQMNGLLAPVGRVFAAINLLNPIYWLFRSGGGTRDGNADLVIQHSSIVPLLVLIVVYCIVALLQWRRVEA